MELRATVLGKHLAQHPYDRVEILTAGVRVSGGQHEYLIPFNQLLSMHCKRGLVWGELEFVLADEQVVRLHGTQWQETQIFWRHLSKCWQQWSQQMSEVAAGVLHEQYIKAGQLWSANRWISLRDVRQLCEGMHQAFEALPFPLARLQEFANCQQVWHQCDALLKQADTRRQQHNEEWCRQQSKQYETFFLDAQENKLDAQQVQAVVCDEDKVLVQGGAGSGKSTVLLARAGWLLLQDAECAGQILLLTGTTQATERMNARIEQSGDYRNLQHAKVTACSLNALILHIVQQAAGKKNIQMDALVQDVTARQAFLVECWQKQCAQKPYKAKAWRQWLEQRFDDIPDDDAFWLDEKLAARLAPRLDQWVNALRQCGMGQKTLVESVDDTLRPEFAKQVGLLMPLVTDWKAALKARKTHDAPALMLLAMNLLDNKRFVSPWKSILLDDYQDLSAPARKLLVTLWRQNPHTRLFATGDGWLTTKNTELAVDFASDFGETAICSLKLSYRLNSRLTKVISHFMQPVSALREKTLACLNTGDKKSVTLLPKDQLTALLDKLSGYATAQQCVLLLARYAHLRPAVLASAATRWPQLNVVFMTIDESKGLQADYVIICGLDEGADGLPGCDDDMVMHVLNQGSMTNVLTSERYLLSLALTRVRERAWVLFDNQHPSVFVAALKQCGAPLLRKP